MQVECWAKKIFATACIGKIRISHGKLRISHKLNFKIALFHWVKKCSCSTKLGMTYFGSKLNTVQVHCRAKIVFAIACMGKKVTNSHGNLRTSQIKNFEIRFFSWGPKVAQN